jgi:hypothetical protein
MSQKLQEAVAAARAGETKTAQRLLADILEENPDEVHAWFLLSHLVDSETKQIAYLKKVVALDPTHIKARQRLGQLQARPVAAEIVIEAESEAAPLPVSTDPFDYEAQAMGDTVPDWMAGDAAAMAATAVAADQLAEAEELLDIPDWLQTSLDEEEEEDQPVPVAITEPEGSTMAAIEAARQAARVPDAPPPPPDAADAAEVNRLNRILTLLVVFAVLIVVAMAYLFFFL